MEVLEKVIKNCGYIFTSQQTAQIGNMLELLFPERFTSDESMYEITASQVISQILHIILEDAHNITCAKHQNNSIVSNIIREIEMNYASNINMTKLAKQNFVSIQHMIRLFKSSTGYTPYEYLKKYRLQKAGKLLIHSNLSISEIAAQTGFCGANNFIFQFKNEHGMTPGHYRKLF